jgi:4-amino-4-deoxy-L-arabinose transferase-like glycosyltransferase
MIPPVEQTDGMLIVMRLFKAYGPEFLIACIGAFFALRELGTFPEPWADDSLFMIVARNVAEGRGYQFPIFTEPWYYSFFLAVGPTVILPPAILSMIVGFSVTAARAAMLPYVACAAILTYRYAYRNGGRVAALISAALLVTFSAFMNTGKTVMGEVPGFCFLLGGIMLMHGWNRSKLRPIASGVLLGLAIVTKLTAGVILPAMAVAWLVVGIRRDWPEVVRLTIAGLIATLTFVAFFPILGYATPEFFLELKQYGLADGGTTFLNVLRTQPELLTRFQYLAYGFFALTGLVGVWRRSKASPALLCSRDLFKFFFSTFIARVKVRMILLG